MGKKSRKKRSGRQPPNTPPEPTTPEQGRASAPDCLEPSDSRLTNLLVLVGAAILLSAAAFTTPVPPQNSGAAQLVRTAASAAAVCVLLWLLAGLYWKSVPRYTPTLVLTLGGGILLALLGLCPEWSRLPMQGIGERLWGFPIAFGAPIAGAALWSGRSERSIVVAGLGCCLLLVGLLQPHAHITDLRLAIAHHIHPWNGHFSAGVAVLLLLALFGLCSTVISAHRAESSFPRIAGFMLLAYLPAWCILQYELSGPHHTAALFMLILGTSLWLTVGLRDLLHDVPEWTREWLPLILEATAVLAVLCIWILLKSFTWRWSTTDENIYLYGATLLADGTLPYRDFFFAHPPMHLIVPAIVFKVFGFSLTTAKLIPVAATIGSALISYSMMRSTLGRLAAFFTLGSFLFAMELLQASTNLNGVNLAAFWLIAGTALFLRRKPLRAGIALGLAVSTGIYALAGSLALLAMAPFSTRNRALRLISGFVGTLVLINGGFWYLGGDQFIEGVYGFHLLKAKKPLVGVFLRTLYHHTPLYLGMLLAPVVGAWLRFRNIPMLFEPLEPEVPGSFFSPMKLFSEPGLGQIKILWLQGLALLVQLALVNELYSFYFVIAFPFAAAALGYTVAGIISACAYEFRLLATHSRTPLWWGTALLPVAFASWVPLAAEANWAFSRSGSPQTTSQTNASGEMVTRRIRPPAKGVNPEFLIAGEKRYYRWIPPAALEELSGPIVKALFWRDHRLRMAITPGYRHYLWQKSLYFDALPEIAEYVTQNSAPNETVAGNSLVAPAVALASKRRIAAHFVDTNAKRFKTEITDLDTFFSSVCDDNLRYLITSPSGYFNDRMVQSLPTVRRFFRPVKHFPSPMNKFTRAGRAPWGVTLWEVKPPKSPEDKRCVWVTPERQPSPRRRTNRRTSGGGKPVK